MNTGCNLILLEQIAEFLDRFFAVDRFPQEERGGVYLPSSRPVKRLGLALLFVDTFARMGDRSKFRRAILTSTLET